MTLALDRARNKARRPCRFCRRRGHVTAGDRRSWTSRYVDLAGPRGRVADTLRRGAHTDAGHATHATAGADRIDEVGDGGEAEVGERCEECGGTGEVLRHSRKTGRRQRPGRTQQERQHGRQPQ